MQYTCGWCSKPIDSQHEQMRGKDKKYFHDGEKSCWRMKKLADQIDEERLNGSKRSNHET